MNLLHPRTLIFETYVRRGLRYQYRIPDFAIDRNASTLNLIGYQIRWNVNLEYQPGRRFLRRMFGWRQVKDRCEFVQYCFDYAYMQLIQEAKKRDEQLSWYPIYVQTSRGQWVRFAHTHQAIIGAYISDTPHPDTGGHFTETWGTMADQFTEAAIRLVQFLAVVRNVRDRDECLGLLRRLWFGDAAVGAHGQLHQKSDIGRQMDQMHRH